MRRRGRASAQIERRKSSWLTHSPTDPLAYVPRYEGFCTDEDECNETYGSESSALATRSAPADLGADHLASNRQSA